MSITKAAEEKRNFYIQGDNGFRCKAVMEPLDRGAGAVIGNHLRRILLSRVTGAAVYAIQIDGISHQYEAVYGVKEDVVNIILNLKNLVIRMQPDIDRKIIKLSARGPCVVTAGMIVHDEDIDIINHDMVICTITNDTQLDMSLYCAHGIGHESESRSREKLLTSNNSGLIAIDAIYGPVRRVAYTTENVRVGQRTDYDKLIMDIETNGAVSPTDAISEAATHIVGLFTPCIKQSLEIVEGGVKLNPNLQIRIEDTSLGNRVKNCLRVINIVFISDLVVKTEPELRDLSNFGDKSINETIEYLRSLGLSLGMELPK